MDTEAITARYEKKFAKIKYKCHHCAFDNKPESKECAGCHYFAGKGRSNWVPAEAQDIPALLEHNENLTLFIVKYAQHESSCKHETGTCDCGFDEDMRKLKGE